MVAANGGQSTSKSYILYDEAGYFKIKIKITRKINTLTNAIKNTYTKCTVKEELEIEQKKGNPSKVKFAEIVAISSSCGDNPKKKEEKKNRETKKKVEKK